MRALVLLLALLPAGCVGLKTHAEIVSASATLIDSAGAAIDDDKIADIERERTIESEEPLTVREDRVYANFAKIDRAYEAAQVRLAAYQRAVTVAIARGDRTLFPAPAVALLAAWKALYEQGSAVGVPVPEPIPALVERAKEKP